MELREYTVFNKEEILPLYISAGWTNYANNPDRLEKAYQNSLLKIGAFDDGHLIGIIRVVGDGESIIFIQDILVLPEYQRNGVGTRLLRAVMERYPSVYQMELMTDNTEKTVAFYKSLGFRKADELGCCAFMRM
ncbi:GNAT family N-acetyltransferase [Roseburia hominis]